LAFYSSYYNDVRNHEPEIYQVHLVGCTMGINFIVPTLFDCETDLFTVWGALIKKLGLICDGSILIRDNYSVCKYYFILHQHLYTELSLSRMREVTELCADEQTNIHECNALVHRLKFLNRIRKVLIRNHIRR